MRYMKKQIPANPRVVNRNLGGSGGSVVTYAAGVLGFIYLMFEWIVPVVWYRPLLTFLGTG